MFEAASEITLAGPGPQEFMKQIAMAAFDVHEIEADIRGEFGGSDHVRGDGSEFLVAQDVDVLAQSVRP